jgi:dienelactone hydrolase
MVAAATESDPAPKPVDPVYSMMFPTTGGRMADRAFAQAFLVLAACAKHALCAYQGPVAAVDTGYGAPGTDSVAVESVTNSHWDANDIFVFHPKNASGPVPTIFYSHGYGGNDTLYQIEFLRHLASRGYAAVFVPYRTYGVTVEERYATLLDGFVDAARAYPDIVDTARIGFFGHSFGGGATPYLAYTLSTAHGWGGDGLFLYCSAPWYALYLGDTALAEFPVQARMILALYADDTVNDHRMGMDVFGNISIPDSLKDCIVVHSDTVPDTTSTYVYQADHNLPSQYSPNGGEYDAYDSRVTFRLMDALADYTFTANLAAKEVALGHGAQAQISLGSVLDPLSETTSPQPARESSSYEWPCDTIINPRRQHCETSSGTIVHRETSRAISLHRLSRDPIEVRGADVRSLTLRRPNGTAVASSNGPEISVAGLGPGIYLVEARTGAGISSLRHLLADW